MHSLAVRITGVFNHLKICEAADPDIFPDYNGIPNLVEIEPIIFDRFQLENLTKGHENDAED